MQKIKHIKVLIWDLDGTLYRPIPAMLTDREESAYRVIINHTGWTREKTINEFRKIYPKYTPSITKACALLANIPLPQAAYENELYKNRKKYLKSDPQLQHLFLKLTNFTHFMLVNGIQEKTREALSILGLSVVIFREIVTSEVVGENKPSEKGFRYILEKTQLRPEQHLMIGDRELVDLAPAKKLGMKTCLVWSDKASSDFTDIVLPTVYQVQNLVII